MTTQHETALTHIQNAYLNTYMSDLHVNTRHFKLPWQLSVSIMALTECESDGYEAEKHEEKKQLKTDEDVDTVADYIKSVAVTLVS